MKTIEVEGRARVRVIAFNRPEKRNAFNLCMASEFAAAVREADADDAVRVLVVTGRGDDFSAGADMSLFAGQADPVPESEHFNPGDIHKLLFSVEKPILAAVRGRSIGMGVTMLPCFDMVYAAEDATFLTPFVRLGLVCELGSSYTFPRSIGRQRASELLFRAKAIDASTAERWGLVCRVFPGSGLLGQVIDIATDIAELPPETLRKCKALLRQGERATDFSAQVSREEEVLATCYGSEENVQAAMAFFARKRR